MSITDFIDGLKRAKVDFETELLIETPDGEILLIKQILSDGEETTIRTRKNEKS